MIINAIDNWYLISAINRKSKCHPVWTISRHCSQHPQLHWLSLAPTKQGFDGIKDCWWKTTVSAKSLTSPTFLLWHSIDKTRLALHISHRRKLWNTSQTLQASLYYMYIYIFKYIICKCLILFDIVWHVVEAALGQIHMMISRKAVGAKRAAPGFSYFSQNSWLKTSVFYPCLAMQAMSSYFVDIS